MTGSQEGQRACPASELEQFSQMCFKNTHFHFKKFVHKLCFFLSSLKYVNYSVILYCKYIRDKAQWGRGDRVCAPTQSATPAPIFHGLYMCFHDITYILQQTCHKLTQIEFVTNYILFPPWSCAINFLNLI